MNNQEKLQALLSAIDTIETQSDGSVMIQWRKNVVHRVPGYTATFSEGNQILRGKQIHFNPEFDENFPDQIPIYDSEYQKNNQNT